MQNKGQYQDNFKIQDNFRITLKFQEFQDCWDPWNYVVRLKEQSPMKKAENRVEIGQ